MRIGWRNPLRKPNCLLSSITSLKKKGQIRENFCLLLRHYEWLLFLRPLAHKNSCIIKWGQIESLFWLLSISIITQRGMEIKTSAVLKAFEAQIQWQNYVNHNDVHFHHCAAIFEVIFMSIFEELYFKINIWPWKLLIKKQNHVKYRQIYFILGQSRCTSKPRILLIKHLNDVEKVIDNARLCELLKYRTQMK